ncbi:MAG: hypothetical protein LBE76_00070 [Nitrososphaerota archaeon]|jgi:hypothetical protein|nr:hypothetical protein [Nitrososphaerota archaeon]
MPSLGKLLGFKLGKHEKSILLLMRKGNVPLGKPIPIWADIYQMYDIDFSVYQKKDQPEEQYKENKYKCALTRLVKGRLIKPAIMVREDFSVFSPKGHGYNFYCLTELGGLVVERLYQQKCQQELLLRAKVDLGKVLGQFCGLGIVEVTVEQIRDALWQLSMDSFGGRVEFDRFWNNTRLGLMLRGVVLGRARLGVSDGRRVYYLWG